MKKKLYVSLAVSSCLALAACGGGSSGNGNNSSDTPAPGPALADNVLFSNSTAADSVTAVINKADIIRAVGEGADQALSIAGGTAPMTGNANTATGDGWLASGDAFVRAAVTLVVNRDGKSYTLSAQGSGIQASNATMQPATNLVTPTLSALSGHYGITSSWAIDIDGSSFSGTYGYNCTIAGTLSPNDKTVDLTNVTFQTASWDLNPAGNVCPFAGKTYSGTGYLIAPSAAYAKGAFDIVFDDSASGTPTSLNLYNYIRQ